MKTVLWRWASFSALAIAAIFTLAYGAGARSGGLSLLDFGALPSAAGLRLLAAALLALIVVGALMWTTLRILHPLERLTHYAGRLGEGDMDLAPPMESEDDFGFIAEQLARSAEQLATAAADQRQLADLQARVAAFDETAQRAAAGDFAVRAADEGDDALAQALRSFNQLLMRISAVLASAAATATALSDTTAQAQTTSQQAGRTLMDQDRELAGAANAFAAIPPSFKQVADSAETVSRTSQQAAASTEVVAQNVAAAQPQAQQVLASLRTAAGTLANLQHGAEHLQRKLRVLGEVTGRANLLALNAGLELARAGHAGRTSVLLAEQFRDLAQQSNATSNDLETLVHAFEQDCAALLHAFGGDAQALESLQQSLARSEQALAGAQPALRECGARGEVVALAAARQADSARAVEAALQTAADLQRLAAQQLRQLTATAEQAGKLASALRSGISAGAASGTSAVTLAVKVGQQ